MTAAKIVKGDSVAKVLDRALSAGGGLLRLTPTWVPRSFLHPGKRIKLHPDDWYAYGAHRGGIDERWFASTTEAANEGRVWRRRPELLRRSRASGSCSSDAVAEAGARLIGKAMWEKYKRWPVYSKFFDNMGPIPHHMHQKLRARQADRPGRQARELLLPAATQQPPTTTSPTRSWAWSRARPRPTSAAAWRTGTRATTASSTCRRPIA